MHNLILKVLKLLLVKNTVNEKIFPGKTKGFPILKHENGKWLVIAHSDTKEKAEASIRARYMGEHRT